MSWWGSKPFHYITTPPRSSFVHSLAVCRSPYCSCLCLALWCLRYVALRCHICIQIQFTSKGVLLGHRPPGLSFTSGRPTAVCEWPFCLPLMAHCWAGQANRAWQGYTGPLAQSGKHGSTLPAAIFLPFLHAPLPLLRSFSLFSCLFLELADFYLLKRANMLWNRKVCYFFSFVFFLDILQYAVGHLTHVLHTHIGVNTHTVHSCTHAQIPFAFDCSLFSAPRETVDWRFWLKS